MINTLIFDLDRTLLNLDSSEFRALKYLYDRHFETNISFDDFFKVYRKHNDIWWFKKSRYEANEIEVKQNRFRDTIEELNIKTSLSLQEISDLYFDEAKTYWTLYDGAIEALKFTKDKYTLGMITNGFTKTQNKKIDALNIRDYFKYICLSQEIGYSKPDKRIFEHTLSALGAQPNQSVYIGDDFDNDILGANNAGITPIWFNPNQEKNEGGYLEFSSFTEINAILSHLE